LICDTLLLITEIGNNPSGFLTLAGSVESAGKSRQGERPSRQYADFSKK
jgi:hypothetical protein